MDAPDTPHPSAISDFSDFPPNPNRMPLTPSSPRLPSPPPPTEIQIGPRSPSGIPTSVGQEQSVVEANAKRRIHPGTKAADMAAGPPLVPLNELDSAFQLQEHLKALHYHYTRSTASPSTISPLNRTTASILTTSPPGVDRTLWLYELCRFLLAQINSLITGFLFDTPPCSSLTCPEMRASEWQFLCAVHEQPKSCCAIDYCCHTLDWATGIVTSQRIFPSRLSLGSEESGKAGAGNGMGIKHLVNIFRRLHRIFAHAWFQHRGVFWQVEGQMGLYVLFKTVCDVYELLPAENYKLPPEAEGLEESGDDEEERTPSVASIMKRKEEGGEVADEVFASVGRSNTRRHVRQNPSVGSAVTTVLEADEDETDITARLGVLNLDVAEETETEVPVIVEHYPEQNMSLNINTPSNDTIANEAVTELAIQAPTEEEEQPAPPATAPHGTLEELVAAQQPEDPPFPNTFFEAVPETESKTDLKEVASVDKVVPDEIPRHQSNQDPALDSVLVQEQGSTSADSTRADG